MLSALVSWYAVDFTFLEVVIVASCNEYLSLLRTIRKKPSLKQHCGKQPLHASNISNSNYGSSQTVTQAAQTSRRVLESAHCSPWRGSLSLPRPPSLQLLSLNVNGLRDRQKRAALFAVLQAGPWHVIALQEPHHATQAEAAQWRRERAGTTAPWDGSSFWAAGTPASRGVALLFKACPLLSGVSAYAAFRWLHPQAREFTHTATNNASSARIDRWLVSDSLLPNVSAAPVTDLILSDHYGVAVAVSLANAPPRGPGLWSMPPAIIPHSFFSPWVTGELSTLRRMMKVPNEPGLSPNNGLENVFLSDQFMAGNPLKGQAKCLGAKTTSSQCLG